MADRALPRVLVADDDLEILGLLVRSLERLPCEVRGVCDGQAALEAFEQFQPDLLVLDVIMPHWSGVEVCRRVKAATADRYVPVVLVTGRPDVEIREEALEGGADEYLSKPFAPYELRARVRPLLRAKALHDDLRAAHGQLVDLRREIDIASLRRTIERPVRKDVTILFSDVRNFTQISDQLDPEEVHAMLGDYIAEAAEVVRANGGSINKIMGDGVMALFGDRDDRPDHPIRGLRAGLEMGRRAHVLQARMHTSLPEAFSIGIGIHSGSAIVGTLGSGDHVDYTAIGASVNLAARLQALSSNNQVVASSSTYDALRDLVTVRNERREVMKGFAHPIRVGEIVSIA